MMMTTTTTMNCTGSESEEEAQIRSISQQSVDATRHPSISLVDQLPAEVVVDLARDGDIWRRSGAARRHQRLLVDYGRKQAGVEVAAVVLAHEVVGSIQRRESFVDGQQRRRRRQLDAGGTTTLVMRQSLIQRIQHLRREHHRSRIYTVPSPTAMTTMLF